MRNSGYQEDPAFKSTVEKMMEIGVVKGYFCAGCKYLRTRFNTSTGYWCAERYFPDQPWGCCDYYMKKT